MTTIHNFLFSKPAVFFDKIEEFWNRKEVSRATALFLVCFFLLANFLILLNRLDFLPTNIAVFIPKNFYAAIGLAFTLVLLLEVIELVFALAGSVSLAAGKQLEIMALILLREVFIDIGKLDLITSFQNELIPLLQIGLVALSGLILFAIRIYLKRLHYLQSFTDMKRYIEVKKFISLVLLCFLFIVLCSDSYQLIFNGQKSTFFVTFYTALIFTDILLVLVGQYFSPSFQATFRNSGFAVSTLIMRIAIGAPHHISALLCIFAGLYLLALAFILQAFRVEE